MAQIKAFSTFILTLILSVSFAQIKEKCTTVHYNNALINKLGKKYSQKDFETWVSKKIKTKKLFQSLSKTNETTYIVPVVIHVINNGEPIGTDSNIPLDQINEQIKILNQDFRRQNPDTVRTPSLFKGVASDANIEFRLAVQDPDGAPTDGIVRVNGKKKTWQFEEGDEMKKLSYWPSENYVNVWVVNLGNNTLGYSQFPTSDILPGLEEGSNISETDGVVIHYKEFGRGGNATKRSRGRTLTHELGHFLGLKHIWGDDDGSCDGTDYVDDTPDQGGPTTNCPGFPNSTCGNESDMFMNFLDYTPDTCMNMFTNGQKDRMRIILENSPRRKSLLTSPGLITPTPVPLDAAITKIISPTNSICDPNVSPVIVIRNLGTDILNTITIEYSINGNAPTSITRSLSVKAYDTANLYLPQISVPSLEGENQLTITLKNPNGGIDSRLENNTMSLNYYHFPEGSLPYTQTFDDLTSFKVNNPDGLQTWTIKSADGNGTNNKAAFFDLLNNNTTFGEKDFLITPAFNASNMESLSLSFKYAYAPKDDFSSDVLSIRISTDCGNTFTSSNEIYFNSGSSLATTSPSTSSFQPSLSTQWKEECLNLVNYIGYQKLVIEFIVSNGMGNALYLDDVQLTPGNCNFSSPVGNSEDPKNFSLKIYPNPNNGKMFLDLDLHFTDDIEVSVINPLGQIVLQQNLGKVNTLHYSLEIPEISSGIHFVKIKGNKINLSRKIMIKK